MISSFVFNQTQILQKIVGIQNIITKYFKDDFLIACKNYSFQGYEFCNTKSFLFTVRKAKFLKSKDFLEIRFLCGMKSIIQTHNVKDFFEKSFTHKKSPVFIMAPFFEPEVSEQILDSNNEYLNSYQFQFEVKIRYFTTRNKIRCSFHAYHTFDKKESIKKEIRKILVSEVKSKNDKKDWTPCSSHGVICPATVSPHGLALSPRGLTTGSRDFQNPLPKEQIVLSIEKTIEHMKKGDCYLINITHTQSLPENYIERFNPIYFLQKWFVERPSFGFYFMKDDIALMSFSPERFLIKKGNKIAAQPIKGTQKCSKPKLWKKKKEMHEHTMVVDLLRHDLNGICLPGSVKVQNPFFIKITSSLLQMESTIVGTINTLFPISELMQKVLPGGSISGTPKKRVCELIHVYEEKNRGYYTGIAGIIEIPKTKDTNLNSDNGNRDFDFAILIRSVFKGRKGFYTGVGAGITTLSSAEEEYEEFCLKLRSFL